MRRLGLREVMGNISPDFEGSVHLFLSELIPNGINYSSVKFSRHEVHAANDYKYQNYLYCILNAKV